MPVWSRFTSIRFTTASDTMKIPFAFPARHLPRRYLCLLSLASILALQTFAQAPALPAQPVGGAQQTPLRVGDSVNVVLLQDADVRFEGRIGEAGMIRLPYLGDFKLAGLTVDEASRALETALQRDLYQKATISMHVSGRAPGSIYVYGAVKQPGAYDLPAAGRLTMLQAVSRAGGVSAWADPKGCSIARTEPGSNERRRIEVDLQAAFQDAAGKLDVELMNGDVIFVPIANAQADQVLATDPTPGTIYVYGAVRSPGAVSVPVATRLTILQAVSKAGGISSWADPKNVVVTRRDSASKERTRIPVDLDAAFQDIGGEADIEMRNGDVIYVPGANAQTNQVLSSEPCEVIVVGEVNSPGIILFAPGETRTLMRAIFKAGNFSKFAKSKAVRLVRYRQGERVVETINVEEVMDQGFLDKDVDLEPGDMIIVDQKIFSFQ